MISLTAILAAAVAQFVLGWLWYMPGSPTGKRWMAEMGMTSAPAPSPMMALWLVHAVVAAWVIAMVYGWAGGAGVPDGIKLGVVLSLPAITMEIAGAMTMSKRSGAFVLIQSGYALIGYALMGAIIGGMS